MKTNLRKVFYAIDLLVMSVFMMFLWHYRYSEVLFNSELMPFQWILLFYPMLMRMTADFLLYRREKRGVWTIVVFMIGSVAIFPFFDKCYQNMFWFPTFVFDTRNAAVSLNELRRTGGDVAYMFIGLGLIAWIVLMPIIAYLVLYFRKKLSLRGYSWKDVLGLMMFKDRSGKLFLTLAAIMFFAYTAGSYSIMFISELALYILPTFTFYVINRYTGRRVNIYEFIMVVAAMVIFFEAQYQINTLRILFLVASAVIMLILCIRMWSGTKKIASVVMTFLLITFIIPSFSIGYNVYRVINERIVCPYHDEFISKGVFITCAEVNRGGHDVYLYGLRDRYRTIFPAIYDNVEPYGWGNHEAAFSLPSGKVVYDIKSQSIVHSFTTQNNNLRDYLQFTSCEELQDNLFDAGEIIVMETNTGKIRAMVDFGEDDAYETSAVHESGLIKPIALLAALETGDVKLGSCMKQGVGRLLSQNTINVSGKKQNLFLKTLECLMSSESDSISGIDNVPSITLQRYGYPRGITGNLISGIWSGAERPVKPIQILNAYNVISNNGTQYNTLLYEDAPSCRFGIAKSENTNILKAAIDKDFSDVCQKTGVKIDDLSGYYSVQKYGDSYSVDFCGYYPKKSPRYTFILSLTRSDVHTDNKSVLEIIKGIADYLKTGKEPLPYYTETLMKKAAHNRLAQYRVGECYEYSRGVKENYAKAADYYTESAENGYALAQWKLYTLSYDGWLSDDGVANLEGTYLPYLKESAAQGYSDAQFCLGSAYRIGYCLPPAGTTAKEEAIKWFRLAEKNGDTTAREYLQNEKYNNRY